MAVWGGVGRTIELPRGRRVIVGRGAEVDLALPHRSVSRTHAEIWVTPEHEHESVRVRDCGSRHGTFLDGVQLEPTVEHELLPGSTLDIGDAVLCLATRHTSASESPTMASLDRTIELVADGHVPVLVLGETGSGKERVAERLHRVSKRARGAFVRRNCVGLPDDALDSVELEGLGFGADGIDPRNVAAPGTLFLDEVGELSSTGQVKLLRALELLAERSATAAPRIVASSARDLEAMVREGSFRSDLYFRLAGIVLRVPPLRERLDELGGLARALVAEAAQPLGRRPPAIGSHALALLYRHAWPGNVRELRNVLQTATTLCRGGTLLPEHLPSLVRGGRAPITDGRGPRTLRSQLAEVERARITGALEEAGGNQTRAATLLGISRRALLYRLDALGLPRPRKVT